MTDERDPRERGGMWDSTVAIAEGMGTVFKQTFRPDNTEQYPKEIVPSPERSARPDGVGHRR